MNLCDAVDAAMQVTISKLPIGLLRMEGMSGRRYRAVINKLISLLVPDARYLEIGCYTGSTACAALYGNAVSHATLIDHWQRYGGKEEFLRNMATLRCPTATVIEADSRTIDYRTLRPHNVYLYDGDHSRVGQAQALTLARPALDEEFVFIVDDWNVDRVRNGTGDGLAAIGGRALRWNEIRTTHDGSHPPRSRSGPRGDWHNGYLIAVITAPPAA